MPVPDDYDDWTVADVEDYVADLGADDLPTLRDLAQYEQAHKNRVTAMDAIAEAVSAGLDAREEGEAAHDHSHTADHLQTAVGDTPVEAVVVRPDTPDSAIESLPTADGTERIYARNPRLGVTYMLGLSWDAGEIKEVEVTDETRELLRAGDLQYVKPAGEVSATEAMSDAEASANPRDRDDALVPDDPPEEADAEADEPASSATAEE